MCIRDRPDGTLPRWSHSATAITLCPGLEEVIVFGGSTDDIVDDRPDSAYSRISETTIITFGELIPPYLAMFCAGVVSMATVVMLHAVECPLDIVFSTQGSLVQSGCWWVWPTTASEGPVRGLWKR